jgi:L-aminopeptidase/D-esterase-like protein
METLTGCTVILCRPAAIVGVDVRGSAPGTRETDLCRPGTLVEHADAILLTGGSAMGLGAASGVVRWLWEREIGFPTPLANVPIVPGAVIYDLGVGAAAWPDEAMGYQACASATGMETRQGCVGAGTGASVGTILGMERAVKSGLGTCSLRAGRLTVGAIVVVNALGDVVSSDGTILAGPRDPASGAYVSTQDVLLSGMADPAGSHTTIGVVATDATLCAVQAQHLARVAHDGLARSIRPVHTMFDGDTMFAVATGAARDKVTIVALTALAAATAAAVEEAVRNAVRFAEPAGGLPAASSLESRES